MEARAHVEDDADFAMPVTWVHRRSYANDVGGGGCTAVAAIGRRESGAGGAQAAHLWALAIAAKAGRVQAAFKLTSGVLG